MVVELSSGTFWIRRPDRTNQMDVGWLVLPRGWTGPTDDGGMTVVACGWHSGGVRGMVSTMSGRLDVRDGRAKDFKQNENGKMEQSKRKEKTALTKTCAEGDRIHALTRLLYRYGRELRRSFGGLGAGGRYRCRRE